MSKSERYKVLLYLKGFIASSISKCNRSLRHNPSQSPFSLRYSTTTSGNHPFAVSYLVKNFGFSPESASKWSKYVCLKTSERPDSVLSFFRSQGFSESQIQDVVTKAPWLLSCKPDKRFLPKFEFFLSKGASASDIVFMVSTCPSILQRSLQNHIIPTYEFIKGFLQSDEKAITCIKSHLPSFSSIYVTANVKMLLDIGVTHSGIAKVLRKRPCVLSWSDLETVVKELKELGFHPSRGSFIMALMIKTTVRKNKWDSKVDTFKKWGWSEEDFTEAFKKHPQCMSISTNKINVLMGFWVNHLGWSSLKLANGPSILGLSLEKRIIPRALVVKFLLSKGLMKENAGLIAPFNMSEKLFLEKYAQRFKEKTSHIVKLYEESFHSIDK